ncbi:uracil-xanthine permease family protein [Acidaminobacter sp.]|uniref:uracil-xanthine permease family protein n=1 Tax=Acidaminobacter sp. TaxID=1872102 RepID=UPI0013831591|nr:solute carrier family 23 protein [Acidaminobacter sp.]MDK9711022.1 NCS2 family nucleobase:cation symporter [Acidaminobacter sp.]MZQ98507.1 uracil permease [Acidaminobacter sp.]
MSKEELNINHDGIRDVTKLGVPKMITLGIQHTFTMFGATVLVPIITGMNISVALFMAGIGTLLFHVITQGKVPAFLGSSFAFIAPILAVAQTHGMEYAQGGIVVAGLIYLLLAGLIAVFGIERVLKFFPPVVTGPIIIVIGLKLAPTAVSMASGDWLLAIVAFVIVTGVSVFAKGFLKVIPVIIGLIGGYVFAVILGRVDFTPIQEAAIFGIPAFTVAKFNAEAVLTVAPIALATMIEHIGDVLAISSTVKRDFTKDPGFVRTLMGDGLATALSAMFGGPANTTYSENTGVLALTKAWDPKIMQIAAVFAIILGLVPKLSAVISTIPTAVIGGISIILFGMIASIGARTLVENKVDFTSSRNLIIAAVILVLGLGGAVIPFKIGLFSLNLEGMALAAIVGILLNVVLPESKEA